MEQWAAKDSSRKFLFSKRAISKDEKNHRVHGSSSLVAFTRPISALARHRVHQLSDIVEASTSSKGATVARQTLAWTDGSKDRPATPVRPEDTLSATSSSLTPAAQLPGAYISKALGNRAASAISLPLRKIPERRSSASIFSKSVAGSAQSSMQNLPNWRLPELDDTSMAIPNHGRNESPVRQALNRAAQSSEVLRVSPLRTFIRTTHPHEILDHGPNRHARVEVSVQLPSPLFVGGGTVEGQVLIEVDGGVAKAKTKPIYVSKMTVDIVGVEEINDGRRYVFLSLATELFNRQNPPPPSLVTSQSPIHGAELWWQLKPATSIVPFCINLPLKLGPPPYFSKQASIQYLLCPTMTIRTGDKRSVIRQAWNIQMLTVHDPEKALASLPSPLLAADTFLLSREPDMQTVKLTAGLHRQTWVNGSMIFIDLHISNNTTKSIKRIDIQLEKSTLWYTHTAAGTCEQSANYLRLPKRTDSEIVASSTLKKGKTWRGVPAHSSDIRTCELDVPRGHVTVSTGRYFEVRYFVNVVVTVTIFKTVAVQLPVTIIHINSLDILPNSLAQVAASIESKRKRTVPTAAENTSVPPYHQGQAFAAPLRQSLERELDRMQSRGSNDLRSLTNVIDNSPRRYPQCHIHGRASLSARDENVPTGRPGTSSTHHHLIRRPSCHCHLGYNEKDKIETTPVTSGPRLPRLQVSTSGLGFSESEFEVPADSPPRKVMLSERERNMINQARELQKRHQHSNRHRSKPSNVRGLHEDGRSFKSAKAPTWTNVVANSDLQQTRTESDIDNPAKPTKCMNSIAEAGHFQDKSNLQRRSRSNTVPERLTSGASSSKVSKRSQSTGQQSRRIGDVDGPPRAVVHDRVNNSVELDRSRNQDRGF